MKGTIESPRVRDLAPTARLVYLALQGDGRHTPEELLERTGADKASLTRALRVLRDEDLVEADSHPVDGRRKLYGLSADPSGTGPMTTGI